MTHSHATPVEGCFGCKVATLGYQGLRSSQGADPVQRVPVTADDGARAGRPVGEHAIHWDGRQDATIYAPKIELKTQTREM